MKGIRFSTVLLCCFFLESVKAYTQYKFFSSCYKTTEILYGSDAIDIRWSPPTGTTSCNLTLQLFNDRNIEVSINYAGGSSSQCESKALSWSCTGGSLTSCPVLMYTLKDNNYIGSYLSNYRTEQLFSDFLRIQYCGGAGMASIISIYIYATYDFRILSAGWQFVYVGIPIILGSIILISVVVGYLLLRNRSNRRQMMAQQQTQMTPAIVYTTTDGSTNLGYLPTNAASNQSGNIQEPIKQ